ncbi:NYN domain-containing protein [Shimia sp.]|uniref:NYN domain-containing protein n=1 Tax=Shimia sp. TaxID=1954381 RepID=UPI003569C184
MSKIAILIDGGYFLKRLSTVRPNIDPWKPDDVADAIARLVTSHLTAHNKIAGQKHPRSNLYRVFYYDASPYLAKGHKPISKSAIDYSKTKEARFRLGLFERLRRSPNTAVRLGEVRRERGWIMKEEPQKELLSGRKAVGDLTDDDFAPGLRQKAVDMKIGLDIASLTLKKQVRHIVLVAGDADFVPAAKLARREGVRIVLDPLWRSVAADLFEHIDMLYSGFPKPKANE